jgi:hypothetical protein
MQTGVVLLAEQMHRQQKKQNKRKIRTNFSHCLPPCASLLITFMPDVSAA